MNENLLFHLLIDILCRKKIWYFLNKSKKKKKPNTKQNEWSKNSPEITNLKLQNKEEEDLSIKNGIKDTEQEQKNIKNKNRKNDAENNENNNQIKNNEIYNGLKEEKENITWIIIGELEEDKKNFSQRYSWRSTIYIRRKKSYKRKIFNYRRLKNFDNLIYETKDIKLIAF